MGARARTNRTQRNYSKTNTGRGFCANQYQTTSTRRGGAAVRTDFPTSGTFPSETAGSSQEVPLKSRITPWVFNKRSNLTFICVSSACIYCAVSPHVFPNILRRRNRTKEHPRRTPNCKKNKREFRCTPKRRHREPFHAHAKTEPSRCR